MNASRLYSARFPPGDRERKKRLWQTLCEHFFQRYVRAGDVVLDLGAGYCEFINHIQCARKIAVDLSADLAEFAAPDVEVRHTPSTDLAGIADASVDVVFTSNFFEHLPCKADMLATLSEVRRVLRPGGKLLILQPNIRYVRGEYWDFFDHYLPLTERSVVEALALAQLVPVEVRARFLPYTTKSLLPQSPWLVRLYLLLPLAHRLLGKQAWIVAVKPQDRRTGA